jgi:1-acyl-sn-glycerol-3-phosphate acyltransferase
MAKEKTNQKKKKAYKVRHKFWYAILRPLVIVFLKIKFGYKFKKVKDLPENYIVLSNHTTDFDPVFVGAGFKKQMYFVASEHITRWNTAYKLLKSGKIKAFKLGTWKIPVKSVYDYINQKIK